LSARILAVEDTPSLRALLELCLQRAGYTVELAEDGRSAVDKFVAEPYDAVIMDIQMPVMDGLTAVARMREHEESRGAEAVPILALTANTEPADLRRCLDAGFTATVRKPFGRAELLAALALHLDAPAEPAPASDRIVVAADPEFADLIPPFLDTCRREAELMRSALERRDYPAIVVSSHKLTGSGASFGFKPVSDECRGIEAAAKAFDGAAVLARLEAVTLYLRRVSVVYR
jgi:CheY-like chemotaxis protein